MTVQAIDGGLGVRPSAGTRTAGLPLWRLYAMRAAYLLMAVGLGIEIWPGIVNHMAGHGRPWELMEGVVQCVLGAVCLLAVLGLRYPTAMVPLLLFELVWKSLWLFVVARPMWMAGTMDENTWATAAACLMGVVFPVVIPWGYVVRTFGLARGDRWI